MKNTTVTLLLQIRKVATMAAFSLLRFLAGVVVVAESAPKFTRYSPVTFFLAKIVGKYLSNIAVTTVTTVTFIFFNLLKHRTVLRYSLVTAFFKPP